MIKRHPIAETIFLVILGFDFIILPLFLLTGCSALNLSGSDGFDIGDHGLKLAKCQAEARQAPDGGHVKAYNDCKADAGIGDAEAP